jgi:stage V sporulation protein B
MAVLAAKVFFILSGLIQQTLLPRLIGLDGYGALARVFAIANIANNVVVSSSIQGVSRSVAQTPDDRADETVRRTLKTHLAIAIPVAVMFFFFAPVYASFQGAPHIIRPLQVVSLVVLFYGLYAPLVGALNGQRRFTAQAGLDITYAVLRTTGLLGLGWFFAKGDQGVLGACIGFAGAAILIFPVALKFTGVGKAGDAGPTVKQHLMFIAPVALGQVFLQLLMQSDISVLGHFASKLVVVQGLTGDLARETADKTVGVYRACQLFAFLPFQLLITLTFIMFPMLAKAKAENDQEAVANYVRTGMRLAFVFACVMVATVSSLGPHLLHLMFPDEVGERGGQALRLLALGQGAFAIFYIETTVLTSLGRERMSAILTGVAAGLIASLCFAAGFTAEDDAALLLRTAMATTAALSVASVIGAFMVYRTAGSYVSPLTAIRVLFALGAVSLLGLYMPYFGKLMVIPQAAGMTLLSILLLLISGEVGKKDLEVLRKVIRRKA